MTGMTLAKFKELDNGLIHLYYYIINNTIFNGVIKLVQM